MLLSPGEQSFFFRPFPCLVVAQANHSCACRFEVDFDGEHLVGLVKENEEAEDDYDDAIAMGKGAYLLQQSMLLYCSLTLQVSNHFLFLWLDEYRNRWGFQNECREFASRKRMHHQGNLQ